MGKNDVAKRKRRPKRVRTQRNRARKDQMGGPLQETATLENKQSSGAFQTNSEKEVQNPKYQWVTIEHRDADGNPTLPKELIASTFPRRYEEVPEGTEIKVSVLTGYKPKALMMIEQKIYEIHRISVQGWRRSGQIAVEMDGWRQHEAEWFKAMRGVGVEVSDPGLPGPHNQKAHYIVSKSSFHRKVVRSVGESGSENEIQMYEGTLDIIEKWRSAWCRQEAEVLNMGFKYFLIPVLSSLLAGLLAGLAVWWIVSSDVKDSAIPENSGEYQLQGNTDDSETEPSDGGTNHPPIETPPNPTKIEKQDSTGSVPKGEINATEDTVDGKEERIRPSDTNPANLGLEGYLPELLGSASTEQEQVQKEKLPDKE